MKFLSLFSGIGGFDLGLERAGMECVGQVEINEWCRKVLNKHWPEIPKWTDIKTFNNSLESIASPEASHAKTFHSREKVPDWKASVLNFGGRCYEPFAWFDQDTSAWRTWQRCAFEGWERFSDHWPRKGMTRNGIAYSLGTSVRRMIEKERLSLPTPTANEGGRQKSLGPNAKIRPSLGMIAKRMKLPTPRANDAEKRGDFDENNPRNGLPAAVKRLKLPTPGANEHKGSSRKRYKGSQHFRGAKTSEALRNCEADPVYLNPQFEEMMMGFPIGWTELGR